MSLYVARQRVLKPTLSVDLSLGWYDGCGVA